MDGFAHFEIKAILMSGIKKIGSEGKFSFNNSSSQLSPPITDVNETVTIWSLQSSLREVPIFRGKK